MTEILVALSHSKRVQNSLLFLTLFFIISSISFDLWFANYVPPNNSMASVVSYEFLKFVPTYLLVFFIVGLIGWLKVAYKTGNRLMRI